MEKYAEDNGFTPYEFIYDDGFSGADFERPAFSKMIKDVEAGKVGTIILKDAHVKTRLKKQQPLLD